MATTATAPSAVTNGAASNSTSPAAGGRPQLKGSITGGSGGGNANRRSTQSPIDGAQRRNSSRGGPWQTNSQQQKYNGAGNPISGSPTPSQSVAMKSRASNVASGGESDTQDKHMHDRTLYLLISLVGKPITITLRSGARYLGILAGADTKNHDLGVAMKWVRLVRAPLGDNSDEKVEEGEYVGGGPEKTMIFEPKDLVDIFAERVPLGDEESQSHSTSQNGALAGTFRTDTDISGNLSLRERELHRWQPDEAARDLSLEETNLNPGQTWNQFEANERLFGVKSDFNPDIYTTKLDRSHPLYQQREAMADKIAREIESSGIGPNMNPHLAEERGVAWGDDSGKDEEDRYGAVQRTSVQTTVPQTNTRYTPPALRAPTGLPTVPGAPHDPAIIASQLQRPETLQQKQQQQQQQASRPLPLPQITLTQQPPNAVSEEVAAKHKEKTLLPETIAPKRGQPGVSAADPATAHGSEAPLPQEVTENFKRFVHSEKERYRRGKAALVQRDRASKLEELKKFSREFTLKTEVPQDLVPILAKDKSKQAEIIEKAKQNVAKIASVPTAAAPQPAQVQKPLTRVPPPNSFAAKNPEEFHITRQQLLQGFPQPQQRQPLRSQQIQQPPLSTRLQNIADGRRAGHQVPVKSPVPIPEHTHNIPTGPASNIPTAPKSASPSSAASLNAKALEFKPNPNAISFTPTLGGPSTTATPSPTTSAHAQPSRAASPSAFFGNKKARVGQGKLLIADRFNPFKRMKSNPQITTTPTDGPPKKPRGNPSDYIERAFCTTPIWPTTEQNAEKKYEQMFGKPEFGLASSIHSPQPPHVMPHQPHHQQLPSHVPHINQPPHLTHQPHHPHMPHIGIPPPHYEQEQHLRQIPPVMPSPSLHNATVAPYQQSPVAHHSQLGPMYPPHQQAQYVPSGPGGPGFGYYNGGFRGAAGAGPMMVHGPQPIPYPGAGQFIHHPHIYSPQQPQAYIHGGPPPPPPPGSQGYPSPGRGAPMMMHQGSQQGTPAGPQMMQYAIQPGQAAPMYAGQGQQQSELLLHGQNWLPQRPQSTVSLPPVPSTPGAKFAFSRAASPVAAPSPRPRNLHMSPQLSSATAILSSPSAAYTPFPPASGPGLSSYALQRSQTGNSAMGAGGGRGRRHDSSGGSNGAYMAPMMPSGFVYNSYSNDGPVGMMRGQPHPHHQGSHPPQFYHGPQSHFPPGGRGSGFVPPQPQHQGGQHAPPPAPPQSQTQPTPAETEDGK